MSKITGIFVSLTTAGPGWAGTDDELYLGSSEPLEAREFNLNVGGFNDFEAGTTVPYSIGPDAAFFGGKKATTADADLADTLICQPNVTHVYLRKLGGASAKADDAWRLQAAYVYLIASGQPNAGASPVEFTGWRLISVRGNQVFSFPTGFMLGAGENVTVTSGPNAKQGMGFLRWTSDSVWNNNGDPGRLVNADGMPMAETQ
jgi:Lamin Tail Domain